MAHILVIGASGGIGLETVRLALAIGHKVTALARQAEKISISDIDFPADHLKRINGNARDRETVEQALDGVDAVVHSLGVPLSLQSITQETTLFSDTTRILITAMEQKGVQRLIAVTGLGAGQAREHLGPLFGPAFKVFLQRIYDDKDVQEQLIRETSLDWTIARPGILTTGPRSNDYKALTDPKTWRAGFISRKDVADFVIYEIENARYVRQTPVLIT